MKSKVLLVTGTITILLSVIGATYAYFAYGTVDTSNKAGFDVSTEGAVPVSLVTIGDNIVVDVDSMRMLPSYTSNTAVASDNGILEVRLTAGSAETPVECEYDIYYVYESNAYTTNYTRSDERLNEFTYRLSKNGTQLYPEKNFVSTTSAPQKVGTVQRIVSNGIETIQRYTIDANFYNINADQTANSNGNWKLKFYIDTDEERCSTNISRTYGQSAYTRSMYLEGGEIVNNGLSVYPDYTLKWVLSEDGGRNWDGNYYDELYKCNDYYEERINGYLGHEYVDYRCVQIEVSSPGLENTFDTLSNLLDSYSSYCRVDGNNECVDSNTYDSEQECLEAYTNPPYNCKKLNNEALTNYLKYSISEDIIQKTETCLYASGHEFCMEPNYWVDGDGDGSLTLAKMQADMKSKLQTNDVVCVVQTNVSMHPVDCFTSNNDAFCTVRSDGLVSCAINSRGQPVCRVDGEGSSACYERPS